MLTRRPRPQTESRRITHISAEQKRRFNIKLGFDTLHGLVTTLSAQPSLKVRNTPLLPATEQAQEGMHGRGAQGPSLSPPPIPMPAGEQGHHAAEDGRVHHHAAAGARDAAGGGPEIARTD